MEYITPKGGPEGGILNNASHFALRYLFLPLVWPHGVIGHLGETFGSFTAFTALTLESHSIKSRL
jgi:hypothetical protein